MKAVVKSTSSNFSEDISGLILSADGGKFTFADNDNIQSICVDLGQLQNISSVSAQFATASPVNRAHEPIHLAEASGCYYCGRHFGLEIIPTNSGFCGPDDGPQCPDCDGITAENPPDLCNRKK